jgi:phospholipase C
LKQNHAKFLAATLLPLTIPLPAAARTVPPGASLIQNVIIINQENRSFDNYFGTFPGANGIPPKTCVPYDPQDTQKGCVVPYYDPHDINGGGPHSPFDAQADIDDGITHTRMDGFVQQIVNLKKRRGCKSGSPFSCLSQEQGYARYDTVGYHTESEIPTYWTYAKKFVLQDQLFERDRSWSFTSHLDLASEWAAQCTNPNDAMSCTTSAQPKYSNNLSLPWVNLFQLLDLYGVTWKYYVDEGSEPDCPNGDIDCDAEPLNAGQPGIWNPVPLFATVQAGGQNYLKQHNPTVAQFITDLQNGTLPQVSWIVPNGGESEHPPSRITDGMEYVTWLVNAVMTSRYWPNTAIFISWDDWGGFYDHKAPPNVDYNNSSTPVQGFGLRVPGLMLSPYANGGTIDKSVLSLDSYATFIEDLFTGSARLNPEQLNNPDNRPDIRDSLTSVTFLDGKTQPVGNLMDEFNFNQTPIPPLVLSVAIPQKLTPDCGATIANNFLCANTTVTLTWLRPEYYPKTGMLTYHVTRDGNELTQCTGTTRKCTDTPGSGNHLYRIYSVDSEGIKSPTSGAVEADEP